MNKCLIFCFLMFLFISCAQKSIEPSGKINGLSFVSINKLVAQEDIDPMKSVNANWVSVIPFSFIPAKDNPNLRYNSDWQWIGERLDGSQKYIQQMHKAGLKVMLKPQIWVGRGVFTGFIEMNNEDDWLVFEEKYQEFILEFAKMAEEEQVEMICLGTELNRFVVTRDRFWKGMIAEVKKVYSGKLTYAENWDCFDQVTFWSNLDYIGVDAYFPITQKEEPTKTDLIAGWSAHVAKMDSISAKYDTPLLFTEYGYRSTVNCSMKPWDYSKKAEISEDCQVRALSVLFDVMWSKENFAGGFLWKWFPDHKDAGGPKNDMFTVQNKKAETLVKEVYLRYN
ncbi:MAG: glycoside hydrolase [Crocinitomicaceae bacterium]|nr:glycoside hydrolase [Crocinitomicaceae bacterium]